MLITFRFQLNQNVKCLVSKLKSFTCVAIYFGHWTETGAHTKLSFQNLIIFVYASNYDLFMIIVQTEETESDSKYNVPWGGTDWLADETQASYESFKNESMQNKISFTCCCGQRKKFLEALNMVKCMKTINSLLRVQLWSFFLSSRNNARL